jgi:hypothetical protein
LINQRYFSCNLFAGITNGMGILSLFDVTEPADSEMFLIFRAFRGSWLKNMPSFSQVALLL